MGHRWVRQDAGAMRQGTDPFSTFDDMFAGRGLMLAPFDSSVGGCGALRLGQMGMAGGRE
eukprot:CAMPEP_0194502452 /NCGR_PEP_ID=MMETSP0253-20130528/25775_1 /TAXON_ID=2966 /ORGANISM="Noctiluca scintillans" /LENGTH=59 /DNA_ID=CAMNT_0039344605 /DNA_START=104 /DNA_END=280 /DNA_ORIENTATION=+